MRGVEQPGEATWPRQGSEDMSRHNAGGSPRPGQGTGCIEAERLPVADSIGRALDAVTSALLFPAVFTPNWTFRTTRTRLFCHLPGNLWGYIRR